MNLIKYKIVIINNRYSRLEVYIYIFSFKTIIIKVNLEKS